MSSTQPEPVGVYLRVSFEWVSGLGLPTYNLDQCWVDPIPDPNLPVFTLTATNWNWLAKSQQRNGHTGSWPTPGRILYLLSAAYISLNQAKLTHQNGFRTATSKKCQTTQSHRYFENKVYPKRWASLLNFLEIKLISESWKALSAFEISSTITLIFQSSSPFNAFAMLRASVKMSILGRILGIGFACFQGNYIGNILYWFI